MLAGIKKPQRSSVMKRTMAAKATGHENGIENNHHYSDDAWSKTAGVAMAGKHDSTPIKPRTGNKIIMTMDNDNHV